MKTIYIIYYIAIFISLTTSILVIIGYMRNSKKNKALIDAMSKTTDEFIKSHSERIDAHLKEHNERVNIANERNDLLSRENVKLLDKVEELKERLRDLGIKDFDII